MMLDAAVIGALIAGAVSLFNAFRLGRQSRALESLKTKLGHGQLITATQWNAEFNGLKALWEEAVRVRAIAQKITTREEAYAALVAGTEGSSPTARGKAKRAILEQFAAAISACTLATNNAAPFYPKQIRADANRLTDVADAIFNRHLRHLLLVETGAAAPPTTDADRSDWRQVVELTTALERRMRIRMRKVRVMKP